MLWQVLNSLLHFNVGYGKDDPPRDALNGWYQLPPSPTAEMSMSAIACSILNMAKSQWLPQNNITPKGARETQVREECPW